MLGCLALAALSLLIPYSVSSDLWGWLVWGRELAHLTLDTSGGPSWKPLPVLLTSVLWVFGDAAPALLLVVLRAAWFLAVVLVYRLGDRLAGRPAGLVGAAGLLLIPSASAEWLLYVGEGNAEPLVAALILVAVQRHLSGHGTQALALGCLAALGRPEAWPLAVAYALMAGRARQVRRPIALALVVLVPLAWAGGGILGAGDRLAAGDRASSAVDANRAERPQAERSQAGRTRAGSQPAEPARPGGLEALAMRTGGALALAGGSVIPPYGLAAVAAVGMAASRRRRERAALGAGTRTADHPDARVVIALGAGVAGWILIEVASALIGLPVVPRFMLAPAAVLSLLAGVGFVELAQRVGDPRRRLAAVAALAVITAAFAVPRLAALAQHAEVGDGNRRERSTLIAALNQSGARDRLGRCGGRVHVHEATAAEVAWRLGTPLRAVRDAQLGTGQPTRGIVVVQGPHSPPQARGRPGRRLTRVGEWTVYESGCRRTG